MIIGKPNAPVECIAFSISPDLQAMAFATKDGVLLYKSKNIITDSCKESTISEKQLLRYIKFFVDPNTSNVGLYLASSSTINCIPNIQKESKKKLGQQGSYKLFEVNEKGELIVITENNQIVSFHPTNEKANAWPYDEDKTVRLGLYITNSLDH